MVLSIALPLISDWQGNVVIWLSEMCNSGLIVLEEVCHGRVFTQGR